MKIAMVINNKITVDAEVSDVLIDMFNDNHHKAEFIASELETYFEAALQKLNEETKGSESN